MVFTKREVVHFLVAALVLAFVVGFDDNRQSFDPQLWLINFGLVFLTSAIMLFIYTLMQKCAAAHKGAEVEFRIWLLHQFGFQRTQKTQRGIPLGVILPILITIVSFGKVMFGAVASSEIQTNTRLRFGKKFQQITDFEYAQIIAAGPLTMILIATVMPLFDTSPFAMLLQRIAMILAVSHLIPLPNSEGIRMFSHSAALYIFIIIAVIAVALLTLTIHSLLALIIAFLLACIIVFCYWFFIIFK